MSLLPATVAPTFHATGTGDVTKIHLPSVKPSLRSSKYLLDRNGHHEVVQAAESERRSIQVLFRTHLPQHAPQGKVVLPFPINTIMHITWKFEPVVEFCSW